MGNSDGKKPDLQIARCWWVGKLDWLFETRCNEKVTCLLWYNDRVQVIQSDERYENNFLVAPSRLHHEVSQKIWEQGEASTGNQTQYEKVIWLIFHNEFWPAIHMAIQVWSIWWKEGEIADCPQSRLHFEVSAKKTKQDEVLMDGAHCIDSATHSKC